MGIVVKAQTPDEAKGALSRATTHLNERLIP